MVNISDILILQSVIKRVEAHHVFTTRSIDRSLKVFELFRIRITSFKRSTHGDDIRIHILCPVDGLDE